MSAPPTTRASRSRYASPAVGAGTRNNTKEKVPGNKDNAARSTSMERSRRFMENWIEPDRAKLASFQEDGLIRQGVLETMEPLGTRPKPAMIKKLAGIGREASPTSSARGKIGGGGKKIVLKRKGGGGAVSSQSSTPVPATSPIVTPTFDARNGPIVPVPSVSAIPSLPPVAADTFLPDPVKQSIEEPLTTPRSIAGSYDGHDDDESERESSLPSKVPRRTGPLYIASELARIVEHKDVVKTAVEKGVEEALRHFQYVDAWALQFMYEDKEEDAQFLLLTEAVFTQTATPEALCEWARELHAFKVLGQKGNAALRHFVPEARTNKNYKPPQQAKPAEYGHLITMDMRQVRDANTYQQEKLPAGRPPEGGVSQTEAEAEAEHQERVATPPRKRQKISSRDSARKASHSARASAMKDHGNPGRFLSAADDDDSDLSSLSSLDSLSPSPEPASWKKMTATAAMTTTTTSQQAAKPTVEAAVVNVQQVPVTNGTSKAAQHAEAATPAQPIAGGHRRAPARAQARHRGGPGPAAVPRPASPARGPPNLTSHSKPKPKPNSNLDSRNPSPDSLHSTTTPQPPLATPTPQVNQPSKRSKRGMPNFEPQYRLDDGDEATARRSMARNTTLRLTQQARVKGDSFARATPVDAPSPPERPASSQSSLSSLSEFDELPPEVGAPAPRVAPAVRARATRSAKRTHDDAEEEATPFSLDFPVEAGAISSRAGTPRPNKKQRTGGRRLKLSPTKNKTAAGVTRGASRASPGVNGVLVNQEENDDFCSSCGGNGSLVCCDGCTRAFHQFCHDPIVDPNDDSEWFCHDCSIKRDPSKIGVYSGPFGDMMTNLDKKGATSFGLPKSTREYFEGVRTGLDGEYEEYVAPVKGKKKKEEPKPQEEDLYTIVDKENRPIFCHSCQKSAAFNRPMMPCSLCGLYWHMDCLDPPRPHLPNPRNFICPCHIDDLLVKVPAQMGPAHKFRKIKGLSDIVYAYRRGNTNNGWVTVVDDDDDDEPPLHFRDPDSCGRITQLRSSGITEDFISKLGGGKRNAAKSRPPPALCFRDDAEEIYEAARDLVALSRGAREATAAGEEEEEDLEEMQAQVARLNAKIEARLQSARGQPPVDEQQTTRNRDKTNTETTTSKSRIKAEKSPDPHMPLDSALTPVSDMTKDSDMPLPPTNCG